MIIKHLEQLRQQTATTQCCRRLLVSGVLVGLVALGLMVGGLMIDGLMAAAVLFFSGLWLFDPRQRKADE